MNGNLSGLGFDARQVEPNTGFDAIPAGEYDVVITKSEVKATKAGTGQYVELTLQVLGGQFQNRQLWDRLNLWNPSEKAVAIAKGTLSAICRAVGVPSPNDTVELHNKPLRVRVAVEQDPQRGASNVIKAYKERHAQAASQQVGPAPFASQNPQLMTGQAAPQQYPTVPSNPF